MREEIIANFELAAAYFADCTDIDVERDALMQELDEERLVKLRKSDAFNDYIYVLKNAEEKIDIFDDTIWTVALEKAIVNSDRTITFVFRDGAEVRV